MGPMPGTSKDWKQATHDLCEAAVYPPDKKIDLEAIYRGESIAGYWGRPSEIGWRKAAIEDLDTRVKCGTGGQVYYGTRGSMCPTIRS